MKRWIALSVFGMSVGLFGAALSSQVAVAGTDPDAKCESGKMQELGKYTACNLTAQSKLLNGGDVGRYDASINRCRQKFSTKFEAFEQSAVALGSVCPTVGDSELLADAAAALADHLVATVASDLTDGPKGGCASAIVRSVAKHTACHLKAESKRRLRSNGEKYRRSHMKCRFGLDSALRRIEGKECASGSAEYFGILASGLEVGLALAQQFPPRFTDNGDGTIADGWRQQQWEKKVALDDVSDFDNPHDADNTYPWAGACSASPRKACQPDTASSSACFGGVEGSTIGCEVCSAAEGTCETGAAGLTAWQWLVQLNGTSFGGHADWRLPTRDELIEILQMGPSSPNVYTQFNGEACGALCTDLSSSDCSCTRSGFGATVSSAPCEDGCFWAIGEFVYTSWPRPPLVAKLPTQQYSVRAVRGG